MSKLSDYLMNNTPAANVPEGAAPGYEDDGSSDDSGFSASSIQNAASSILDALSHPSFLQGGTVIAPDYTPRQLDDDASDVPIQEANPTYQPYAASTALNNFIQDHTTVIAPNYTPRPLDDSVYSDIPSTPVASGQFGELEDESVRDERMKDSADYMAANWPRLYGGAVGAAEGFANVVGGIQNAVGGGNGILNNVQRAEEGMQDYREQWNNEYGDSYFLNPNKFATDAGSGIGSTVPIMALSALMPGAAVAGGTRALTSALSRAGLGRLAMSKAGQALIADTVRSPISSLADSLSEYGTVVNDMMQSGMSEDEARRRAIPMFFKNMALDTFTVPLELGVMKGGKGIATGLLGRSAGEGMAKSIAKGAARTGMLAGASGLTEGYQEGAQNALENDVQGKRDGGWYNPFTWTNEDWEAARGGFVGGALMGIPGNVAAGFHPEAKQAPLSAESQEQAQSIKDTLSHGKPKGMSNAAYNAYIELANSGNPDLIKQAASSLESFQESQGNSSSESTDDAATEAYKDYEAYDQKQEIENFLNNNTVEQIGGEDNYNWLFGVLRNGTPEEVQKAYNDVIAAEKATAEMEAKNRAAQAVPAKTGNNTIDTIIAAAQQYGDDPKALISVGARESGGDDINAIGKSVEGNNWFQIEPATAEAYGVDKIYPDWETDPTENIYAAALILRKKTDEANGDVFQGMHNYNGGGDPDYDSKVQATYNSLGDLSGVASDSGNVSAPDQQYYDLSDQMNPQVDGMDPNTMAKMNLLARDFYQKYGHRLLVTSLKRNGDGSSYHDEGHAFDFSDDFLEQNPDARDWLVQQGEKYGLKGLDEFSHPVATTDGGNVHFTDHGGPVPGGTSGAVTGKITSDDGQFDRELDQAAQEVKSDMDRIQAQSDQAMNEIMNDDSAEKTAQEAQEDAENAQKQAEESQQSTQDAVIPDVAQTIRDTSSNIDEINALDDMFTKDGNGNDKFIDTPENRDYIKTNYKDEIDAAVKKAMQKTTAPKIKTQKKEDLPIVDGTSDVGPAARFMKSPHARLGNILADYDRNDPKFKGYMETFRHGTDEEQAALADQLQQAQEQAKANSTTSNATVTTPSPANPSQQAVQAPKPAVQVNTPTPTQTAPKKAPKAQYEWGMRGYHWSGELNDKGKINIREADMSMYDSDMQFDVAKIQKAIAKAKTEEEARGIIRNIAKNTYGAHVERLRMKTGGNASVEEWRTKHKESPEIQEVYDDLTKGLTNLYEQATGKTLKEQFAEKAPTKAVEAPKEKPTTNNTETPKETPKKADTEEKKGEVKHEENKGNNVNTESQQAESKDTESADAEKGAESNVQKEVKETAKKPTTETKKEATSGEDDYHGFLDGKKEVVQKMIRSSLNIKHNPFGNAEGIITLKHTVEVMARSNGKHDIEVRNGKTYIDGTKVPKVAVEYYRYLRKQAEQQEQEAPKVQTSHIEPFRKVIDDLSHKLQTKELTPKQAQDKLKQVLMDAAHATYGTFDDMSLVKTDQQLTSEERTKVNSMVNDAMAVANKMSVEASRKRAEKKAQKETPEKFLKDHVIVTTIPDDKVKKEAPTREEADAASKEYSKRIDDLQDQYDHGKLTKDEVNAELDKIGKEERTDKRLDSTPHNWRHQDIESAIETMKQDIARVDKQRKEIMQRDGKLPNGWKLKEMPEKPVAETAPKVDNEEEDFKKAYDKMQEIAEEVQGKELTKNEIARLRGRLNVAKGLYSSGRIVTDAYKNEMLDKYADSIIRDARTHMKKAEEDEKGIYKYNPINFYGFDKAHPEYDTTDIANQLWKTSKPFGNKAGDLTLKFQLELLAAEGKPKITKDGEKYKINGVSVHKIAADYLSYLLDNNFKDRWKPLDILRPTKGNSEKAEVKEGVGNDGQEQGKSNDANGRLESVEAETSEGNDSGKAGTIPGHDGQEAEGIRTSGNQSDSEGHAAGTVPARTGVGKDDSAGTGERGNKQSIPLTPAQAKPSAEETPGHDYTIGNKSQPKDEKSRYKQNVKAIKLLKQLEAAEHRVELIESDIKALKDTSGDNFVMKIMGHTYTKRKDAMAALEKAAKKFKNTPTTIGEIGGLRINGWIPVSGVAKYQLVGNFSYDVLTGSVAGMENTLRALPRVLTDEKEHVDKLKARLSDDKKIVEQKNPYTEKLAKVTSELAAIDKAIENQLLEGGNATKETKPEDTQETKSNDETQYSVRDAGETITRTKEAVKAEMKEAFKTASNVLEDGDRLTFTMPNGQKITVDVRNGIAVTDEELAQAKKDHDIDGNVVVEGYAQTHGKDAYIAVAQGSREGTGFHEAYHIAEKSVLTDKEKAAITKAIPDAEQRADKYAEWVEARKHGRGTAWGKLFQKIKDFAMKMKKIFTGAETVNDVFRQIESGEVWERKANSKDNQARYSIRQTQDSEQEEDLVKPQDIIDAINDIVHIYEGSRLTNKERKELRESSKFDPDQKQAVRPQATDLYDRHAHAGFNRMGYFNLSNYGRILALHLDNVMNLKGNLELTNKVLDRQDKNAAENKMNGVNERLTPAQARQNAVMDFGAMMIRNPELARETYPAYAKIFDEGLEEHPDLKEKLDRVIQLNETYQGQTAAERAAGSIAREREKVQLRKHPKEWLHMHFDKFYTNWVDDKHIFAKIVARAEAELGRKLAYDYDVHKQAQMALNVASSRALLFLTGGKSTEDTYKVLNTVYGHAITKNVTMKDIMDALNKVSKEDVSKTGADNAYDALGNYLIAMRTEELEKHYHDAYARSAGFDEEGTREIIQNTPESIKKIAQMYWDINTNIVNILQQQGLISKDLAGKLRKYKYYCPMYRDMSDGIADMDEMIGTIGAFNKGGGYANVNNGIKRIEGGGKRPILDPITSLSQMAVSMISKCERNDVAKTFVKLGQDFSGLGDIVVRDPTLKHADPTAFAFTVWQNGEQVVYRTTPEIYDALTNNDAQANRFTIKIASGIAQTLRTGATISPSFIVRNLLRDTMSATVNSKTGFYLPFVDNVRGAWKLHFDKEFSAEYHASGASMSTYMRADADSSRDLTKELLGHKYDSYPVVVKQVRQLISYAWHKYEKFGNLVEDSTRAGEFRRARNQGLSIDQAGQLAREITLDFSRHGKKGQIVNKYVPFFNATIQGTDKFIRTFKDNPMRAIMNTVIWIILPSLGLWAINHDDDWYKELDENTKYTNWAIPLPGGTHLLIPKPQEVGILFGSGIEAVLNQMTGTDPHGMKEWARQYAEAMTPSLYPAVVRPLIEWMTNYSFWTGRNLVPASLQKAPSEMQFTSYTSELAKAIGDTWIAKSIKLSPIAIDNWISGWFGSAGRFVANMLNNPISYVRGNSRPSEPAKYWYEFPVIGSFIRQNGQNSEYINRMYEIQKDMNDDYERSDAGKQRKGKKSSSNKPKELKQVDTAVSSVSKLNKEIKAIRNDPKKDPDQKRREIDQRRTKINDLAKKVVLKFDK